jgi:hypothetical protein
MHSLPQINATLRAERLAYKVVDTMLLTAAAACRVCRGAAAQAVGLCLNRGPISGNSWNLGQVCLLYIGPMYPRQGEQIVP